MRVVRNMVRMSGPEARDDYPLAARLIHGLPKRELLYIAGLYHDIAKGRGGDHSELGAVDAESFCERHHLGERDTQLVSWRSEEHTSELQSRPHLVCRLLLEKKNTARKRTSC